MRGGVIVVAVAGVLLVCLATASAAPSERHRIQPTGIGSVHLGLPKARAISELTSLFGKPSAHFVNSGCGHRYAETSWGHLYVEFRLGKFVGYRYIEYGWPLMPGGRPQRSVMPRLATARGITLGSTLGQLRHAYGRLDLIGTDRWMVRGGLIFYDNSKTEPPTESSRIIEIKIGVCGDF